MARIRWNDPAFEEIRRTAPLQQILDGHAEDWAQRARDESGELGYQARSGVGQTRNRAAVVTTTYRAKRDEARNHTLVRTMPGGT